MGGAEAEEVTQPGVAEPQQISLVTPSVSMSVHAVFLILSLFKFSRIFFKKNIKIILIDE